jgi:hypothetical protein
MVRKKQDFGIVKKIAVPVANDEVEQVDFL